MILTHLIFFDFLPGASASDFVPVDPGTKIYGTVGTKASGKFRQTQRVESNPTQRVVDNPSEGGLT